LGELRGKGKNKLGENPFISPLKKDDSPLENRCIALKHRYQEYHYGKKIHS
jgi:hypothetical protein